MAKVKLLPEIVANKIAAGEVVERPASVVKELIENSIDAKASKIIIEIKDKGMYIRVSDNGIGMSEDDAELALMRHATSKIFNPEDLYNINTLGFRGEALPSIASVSEFILSTAEENAQFGTKITVKGGKILKKEKIPPIKGTTVIVKNLFFNTPARRKFLKSPRVEMNHILRTIMFQSLVHPEIAFKYTSHGKVIYDLPIVKNPIDRIYAVLGKSIANELLSIEYFDENISITGFISRPEFSRKDKKYQCIFVNNRPITNSELHFSIKLAYQEMIESHRHPVAIIYINIRPDLIDVNVHPTKYEIRFSEKIDVKNLLRKTIRESLLMSKGPVEYKIKNVSLPNSPISFGSTAYKKQHKIPLQGLSSGKDGIFFKEEKKNEFTKDYKVIGQFQLTYIIVEKDKSLILIDQHALHEKIIYYELIEKINDTKSIETPIIPISFEIPPFQKLFFEKRVIPALEELSFLIEHFGGNMYIIKSYPSIVKDLYLPQIIFDIMEDVDKNKKVSKEELRKEFITLICCKKAIKSGTVLNYYEMNELVKRYFEDRDKYSFCPHGRPIAMIIKNEEIIKFFHRDY